MCGMRDFIVEFSMSVSRWRGAGATRKVGCVGPAPLDTPCCGEGLGAGV